MDEKEQDITITFANLLMHNVADFFDVSHIEKIIDDSPIKDLFVKTDKRGFFWKKKTSVLPASFTPALFQDAIKKIIEVLSKSFGFDFTEARLETIYTELEKLYSVDLVGRVITPYIPEGYLERYRIAYLSKEELEVKVLQKTQELRKFNNELEDKIKERTTELANLLVEQQKAAKMLIRRDLELTRANEKLHELDQSKSNFISIVAHQLRTPLSGVKWTLNMVLSGTLGLITIEQKSFLMKCYESNERMIILINDMLGADRIDSEKLKYHLIPTQILDLMDNVLFEMTSLISKKELQMSFVDRNPALPHVLIDTEKMRAVLQNLLENAVKYTPIGGRIEINSRVVDDVVQVSIKDSGIGIPDDDRKNIFDRFFRAKNAIKVETDGSGLGLFIAKGIIEKHGGKIWFESPVGGGTTFHFTIPISK